MSDAPRPNALTRAIVTARVIALDAIEGAIEALTWLANQLRSRSQPQDGAIAADVGDAAAALFGKVWQRWEPWAERLRGYAPQPWRDRLTPYGVTGILVGGLVLISLALGSGDRAKAGAPMVQPSREPVSQTDRQTNGQTDRPGKLRPLLKRNPEPIATPDRSPIAPVRTPVGSAPVSPAPIAVPDELSAPIESLPLPTRTPLAVVRDRLVGSKPELTQSTKPERAVIPAPAAAVMTTPVSSEPIVTEPIVTAPVIAAPVIVTPVASASPIATVQPRPIVTAPIRPANPIAAASKRPTPKTPEQKLLVDLQASIVSQVRDISQGLLISLQANFTTQQLTVKLAPGWYRLAPAQQDRLAQTLFDKAQRLTFRTLELLNDRGEPIARSPVIGQQMVILQRAILQPEMSDQPSN